MLSILGKYMEINDSHYVGWWCHPHHHGRSSRSHGHVCDRVQVCRPRGRDHGCDYNLAREHDRDRGYVRCPSASLRQNLPRPGAWWRTVRGLFSYGFLHCSLRHISLHVKNNPDFIQRRAQKGKYYE